MAELLQANEDTIAEAAAVIRAGGLVAFPTETVYGVGANALDQAAIARIFAAKGRPATNPVIVHVARPSELAQIAKGAESAQKLIERFWPGPLTVVLPKKPIVPDIATAGGPTVGVRMPSHPVALALIRAAGVPIAAPSANRSEQVSPTQAAHVMIHMGDDLDIVLDGGHTQIGIESTVVDLTGEPTLLRPGMILPEQIEEVLGRRLVRLGARSEVARSPGQMRRHYAPATPIRLVKDVWREIPEIEETPLGLLAFGSDDHVPLGADIARAIIMPSDPMQYAARLYDALHELDEANLALIAVEDVPAGDEWLAIRDRLARAASE